jgi:hypothetical protein
MDGSSLAANLRPSQPTQGSMRFDRRMPVTHSKSSGPKLTVRNVFNRATLTEIHLHILGIPQPNIKVLL